MIILLIIIVLQNSIFALMNLEQFRYLKDKIKSLEDRLNAK